jgi:multicomponent Na+:H+ antiporter subunit E
VIHRVGVRTGRVIAFVGYFAYEFLKSNVLVLWEIIRWRPRAAPVIVALPLRCRSTLETVFLANLITLTPGTLTLEVAEDPRTLYVHGMFAGDPEEFLRQLRELEDRMLLALRPAGGGDR